MRSAKREDKSDLERTDKSSFVSQRLVDLDTAANYLGVSYWTARDYVVVQRLIPQVDLPALQPREGERRRGGLRRVVVDLRDLDAFIESRKG
jgi:hypothetical protein